MALTYFLIPVVFRRQVVMPGLAKWQPYLFGIGMAVFTLAMMGAGTLGVERRHWDMTFADSLIGFDYSASAFTMMGILVGFLRQTG
jgi:cytochrome c oxidase subunit 1